MAVDTRQAQLAEASTECWTSLKGTDQADRRLFTLILAIVCKSSETTVWEACGSSRVGRWFLPLEELGKAVDDELHCDRREQWSR
jgi:hypothetical protein